MPGLGSWAAGPVRRAALSFLGLESEAQGHGAERGRPQRPITGGSSNTSGELRYLKHRRLLLKTHPVLTEKWVQQKIAADPGLLGLGEVDVKDVERSQPHVG